MTRVSDEQLDQWAREDRMRKYSPRNIAANVTGAALVLTGAYLGTRATSGWGQLQWLGIVPGAIAGYLVNVPVHSMITDL